MNRYIVTAILAIALALRPVCAVADTIAHTDTAQIASGTIIKRGWNVGPLPALAFDSDKGFQFGAIINLYDFGDGSTYPNTRQQFYFEGSYFTKGSQLYRAYYDNRFSIPGVRLSACGAFNYDKAYDFYGLGGYRAYYDFDRMKAGSQNDDIYSYSPFYRIKRSSLLLKVDFIGNIWQNKLFWEAGYHFSWIATGRVNLRSLNKGKTEQKQYPADSLTLYDHYCQWGILSPEERNGGFSSALRLGLKWDTRDKEAAPSRGIWADAHIILAPSFLGTSTPYYRYSATFRHYIPIVRNDILTLAYRINYHGTIGNSAPYYVLPFVTLMGQDLDNDGFGGSKTARGVLRSRVQGLDVAMMNIELRYRFVKFRLWKQNMAFAINAFTDGVMAIRTVDMTFRGEEEYRAAYDRYMALGAKYTSTGGSDLPHLSAGGGIRFIMNENFIVCAEYGVPFSRQDGAGSLYINLGYLF